MIVVSIFFSIIPLYPQFDSEVQPRLSELLPNCGISIFFGGLTIVTDGDFDTPQLPRDPSIVAFHVASDTATEERTECFVISCDKSILIWAIHLKSLLSTKKRFLSKLLARVAVSPGFSWSPRARSIPRARRHGSPWPLTRR